MESSCCKREVRLERVMNEHAIASTAESLDDSYAELTPVPPKLKHPTGRSQFSLYLSSDRAAEFAAQSKKSSNLMGSQAH